MLGGGWPAGPVEVVGDLLESRAVEVALEDLHDHGRLLGIGLEDRLVVARARAAGVGVRDALEPVAVGCAPAVAVALAGVLRLPAAHLPSELLDLELVERLKEVAHEASLGAGLVPGGDSEVDLHPGTRQLSLEGESVEEIAREPGRGVDDDGVKAAGVAVAGLGDKFAPSLAVVTPSRFLVGELARDPAPELAGLVLACLPLRRKRQGRVLLVLRRKPAIPREAHHGLIPARRERRAPR